MRRTGLKNKSEQPYLLLNILPQVYDVTWRKQLKWPTKELYLAPGDPDDARFKNLEELWIKGLPGESQRGRRFLIEETQHEKGTWQMKGCIDFPAFMDGHATITLRNDAGDDVSRVSSAIKGKASLRDRTQQLINTERSTEEGREVVWDLEMECGAPLILAFTEHLMKLGDIPEFLYERGLVARGQFELDPGNVSHINEAIALLERAVELTPNNRRSLLAKRQEALACHFDSRFQLTDDLADLSKAISLTQSSVANTPDGDPDDYNEDLASRLETLGDLLCTRFDRQREVSDIETAVSCLQRAVHMTPDDDHERAERLSTLGVFFHKRFDSTGDLADVTEAVMLGESALELTPEHDPQLPERRENLATSFLVRFRRSGTPSDLAESISLLQKAVDSTPKSHPDLAERLAKLGNALCARSQYTGELPDLTKAISLEQSALDLTPDDHPDLPHRLTNLGCSFQMRFKHFSELPDIAESISLMSKALSKTPREHPSFPQMLSNLSASLYDRFERTGDLKDLTESIVVGQDAVKLTPDGDPELAHRAAGLGVSFHARFRHCGELSDLTQAITRLQLALENTPEGHIEMAQRLEILGSLFRARFEHTEDPHALDQSLSLLQKALDCTPTEHPTVPDMVRSMGNLLSMKYLASLDDTPDDTLITKAISHLKSAATSSLGPRTTRLAAAREWADHLQNYTPESPDLITAFETVLSILSLSFGPEQTVGNRYSNLAFTGVNSGLALDAASAAFACGRLDKALEWLDRGRCLVWGQLTNLRAPLGDLRERDSALADRITTISQRLDAAGSSRLHSHFGKTMAEKMSLEDEARVHQDLVKERNDLVAQVRLMPGFETFLLPPSCSTLLAHLPRTGYVIVLNVHEDRCDALALSSGFPGKPMHIPLPTLSLEKVKRYREALKDCHGRFSLRMREREINHDGEGDRGARFVKRKTAVEESVASLLKGLWIDLVKPIYDALGLQIIDNSLPAGERPRIWWCATGVLSFLPIHAAGVYRASNSCVCSMDYAISSYIPTVSSLTDRVRNDRPVITDVSGLLMTSQPNPGPKVAPPILGTTKEVKSVYALAREENVRAMMFDGSEVTVEAFLEHMERFSSVHLACHGSQKADDPLTSRFLFHDGSLELRAIIKKNLNNADLAFLSACQTSTGEEKLADEAVHLAAGMLAAGYKRVVATMWSIGDNEAPQVAQDFYDYIFNRREEGDMGGFDGSLSAEALHVAIQRLRARLDNSDRSLLAWAPYLLLTDIFLKPARADEEVQALTNLNELWVQGLPNCDYGRRFLLERTTGSQEAIWEMRGFIALSDSVDNVHFTMKSDVSGVSYSARFEAAPLFKKYKKGQKINGRAFMVGTDVCPLMMVLTGALVDFEGIVNVFDVLLELAYHQFGVKGNVDDITDAISLEFGALGIFPNRHPDLGRRLARLGSSLFARFTCTGDVADLTKAIYLEQMAVEKTPDGHPELATRLSNLASTFYARFRHLDDGGLWDLTQVIKLLQRAVELTPDDHPDLAQRLANLSASFYSRFERCGEDTDLVDAISLAQRAISMIPNSDPGLVHVLEGLWGCFYARFQRTREISDLTEVILLEERMVDLTPHSHPELSHRLAVLGTSVITRFQCTGSFSDATKAISLLRRSVDETPDGHPAMPDRLANLGASLHAYFELGTGEPDDLNEAILLMQRAVKETPYEHPELALRLANLGVYFHTRFQSTRIPGDLTESISFGQLAADSTPDDHPKKPARLANLGAMFCARYKERGEIVDLTKAISLGRRAVDIAPEDHPGLADWLEILGDSLRCRYTLKRELSDITDAISVHERAVSKRPEGHPTLPHIMDSLAISFFARFQSSGDLQDISKSVSLTQRALEIIPAGHPDTLSLRYSLGVYFCTKHTSAHGTPDDVVAALTHFKYAATLELSGRHTTQLKAAQLWCQTLRRYAPSSCDLLPAFQTTLDLSLLAVGLDQTVPNRYSALREIPGVALDAASAALALGRVDKALEWLEQGRCLVWGQLHSLRSPLDELRSHDSGLANRIAAISQALDTSGSSRLHSHHGRSFGEKISLEAEARTHHNLAKERDRLIARARMLPGLESFLLPPSFPKLLRDLPPSGYVVVIHSHEYRCDALVLSAGWDGALHIPLPMFSTEKAKRYRDILQNNFPGRQRGVRLRARVNETTITMVFRNLWMEIVKPVFDAIGLKKVDSLAGDTYPRVWWCPTGVVSFLPLHAAGLYEGKKPTVCALDFAIYSYTPTITSLATRVKNRRSVSKGVSGLLMTSQPSPGPTIAPPIPGTTSEVRLIYTRASDERVRAVKLEGSEVTVEGFLGYMEHFSSIHLACHGSQKEADPLASRFIFHDGFLELRSIIKKDLTNADLAFLSACQTSTGAQNLADEAVHLAAGMLAAGYRRVVATMWPIGDDEAPQVAQEFYDYILDRREEGGMGGFDGTLAAEALHHAIQRLRSRLDNSDRSFLAWAPYVHWGY